MKMEIIVDAFISASLFSLVWAVHRLHVVQNAAAGLLTKMSHATPVLISLHWHRIRLRIQFQILVLAFIVLYVKALQQPTSVVKVWSHLIGIVGCCLISASIKGIFTFDVAVPKLWNCLPLDVRSVNTVDTFKKHLKPISFNWLLFNFAMFYCFSWQSIWRFLPTVVWSLAPHSFKFSACNLAVTI